VEDAGTDAPPEASGPVVVGANEVKQSGRIVNAVSATDYVPNPTITVNGKSVVGGADGTYEIAVPKNEPYYYKVAAPDFYTLTEQELILKQDVARGDTKLPSVGLFKLLSGSLNPPRDMTKGLLVVSVRPEEGCASEEGATLALDPPGQSKLNYTESNFPTDRTTVKAGESFSAFYYDVDPGVTVHVIATHPSCTQIPFPYDTDNVTFTGNQKTESGEALSFMRVYLKAK